jgi:hypothetical protein
MKTMFRTAALGLAVLAGAAGYAAAQDRGYDRDDDRYARDYREDNFERGMHRAREIGYHDGVQVARDDTRSGKPFNPNPRGPYAWSDHGYSREVGSRHEYREHYTEAYREGYRNAFGSYRGYGYER